MIPGLSFNHYGTLVKPKDVLFHLNDLKPKYKNLKEESLHFARLNVKLFKISVTKAKKLSKTIDARKTTFKRNALRFILHHDLRKIGEALLAHANSEELRLSVQHILVMILYTHYTDFATWFNSQHRSATESETPHKVRKKLEGIFCTSMTMHQYVTFWGTSHLQRLHADNETSISVLKERGKFYHAVNFECNLQQMSMNLNAPISMSIHKEISQRFADSKGTILEMDFTICFDSMWISYADVDWISCFSEQEKICYAPRFAAPLTRIIFVKDYADGYKLSNRITARLPKMLRVEAAFTNQTILSHPLLLTGNIYHTEAEDTAMFEEETTEEEEEFDFEHIRSPQFLPFELSIAKSISDQTTCDEEKGERLESDERYTEYMLNNVKAMWLTLPEMKINLDLIQTSYPDCSKYIFQKLGVLEQEWKLKEDFLISESFSCLKLIQLIINKVKPDLNHVEVIIERSKTKVEVQLVLICELDEIELSNKWQLLYQTEDYENVLYLIEREQVRFVRNPWKVKATFYRYHNTWNGLYRSRKDNDSQND